MLVTRVRHIVAIALLWLVPSTAGAAPSFVPAPERRFGGEGATVMPPAPPAQTDGWEGIPPPQHWTNPGGPPQSPHRASQAPIKAGAGAPSGIGAPVSSAVSSSVGSGFDAPSAGPRRSFAFAEQRDSPGQRNLLKALGSLVIRPVAQVSDTVKVQRRQPLLREVATSVPDLVISPTGILLHGARDSQLLTLAPGALERFERRIDVLHMLGLQHNDIRTDNIVIDRYGELHLLRWEHPTKGDDADGDLLGLDAVRRFLRQRLGP